MTPKYQNDSLPKGSTVSFLSEYVLFVNIVPCVQYVHNWIFPRIICKTDGNKIAWRCIAQGYNA